MEKLRSIVSFLDTEFKIEEFQDSSNNGLQVENSGRVKKICCGVDASMEFFEAARAAGADLAFCHHAISWDDSLKRLTGLNYTKVAFLVKNNMALYGCHLPLDAHPRHGNNALMCDHLRLRARRPFGLYRGNLIGFRGALERGVTLEAFVKRVERKIGSDLKVLDFGRDRVRRVAVVSGGGESSVEEAARDEVDVYITGEGGLKSYTLAKDYGINVILAGHYATEVFGVREVARLLSKKFDVEARFLDFGIPY